MKQQNREETLEILNEKQGSKNKDIIRYGVQLQMLNALRASGAITAVEYEKMLTALKHDYHVVSIGIHLFERKNRVYTYVGKVVLATKPYYGRQSDSMGKDRQVCIFPLRLKKNENDKGYIVEG